MKDTWKTRSPNERQMKGEQQQLKRNEIRDHKAQVKYAKPTMPGTLLKSVRPKYQILTIEQNKVFVDGELITNATVSHENDKLIIEIDDE